MSRIVKESIDRFFDYDVHVETRTIVMSGSDGVDAAQADRMIKALSLLSITPDKPIKIIMNSPGGDWYHGMAIFDAIRACPCYVTVEVLGMSMSMGSIILQAADERVLHPNATVMIHDGVDSFEGLPKSFEAWAGQSKKLRKKMYEIYADRSHKPILYWERKCSSDYILDAHEAVSEGLADRVFDDTASLV